MGFTKITSEDTANKGVVGLADTPNLSTQEMQAKFDELATDVIIPKFNELSTELDDKNIDERFDERVVSEDISNIRLNRDNQLETSKDGGTTWETTASSGHIIENGAGTMYPSRARLQFSDNVIVMDDLVENKTFISIPAGEKGDKGESATIRVGNVEAGDSVKFENVGSDTDAIFDVTIPKGDKGDAATVRIGSVQTGDNPSVYNSGTTSNAIFNFVLPKGEKGDDGTSFQVLGLYATYADLIAAHPVGRRGEAYAVGDDTFNEVYNWNTSTLQWDNLGALKGAKGDTGLAATVTVGTVTQGNTTSVENVGTSENAVFNFVLEKGEKGDTGNAATIAIGSVEAGDYPEVTNVGTDTNAVFDFKLQRGPQGPQGTPTTVNGKTAASIELDTRDLLMTGYVKEAEGDIATTDTLAVALSKLETRKSGGSIIKVTVDEELVGENITCANGEETYTKVATALTEFNVEGTGEWTITCGESEATVEISYFGIYEAEIVARGAYNYIGWLESAPIIKTFASLEEVLADEVTLRTLFTKHASVDYLCDWIVADSTITEQILGTDLVAKWVNLRDYALDKLYEVAKTSMDSLGKYGFGELVLKDGVWGAKGLVPIMTSNSAPYGEVFAQSDYGSTYAIYKAFDGDDSTYGSGSQSYTLSSWYIGYKFTNPTNVRKVRIGKKNYTQAKLYGSNDGSSWGEPIATLNMAEGTNITYIDVDNDEYYLYYKVADFNAPSTTKANSGDINIQFYGRQLSVSVPKMDSNTSPWGEVLFNGYSSSNVPINAFDKTTSAIWQSNSPTGYIGYRFPSATKIKQVVIQNDYTGNANYLENIEGSNDGVTWEKIFDTRTSITSPTSGTIATFVFDVDTEKTFEYYRANVSRSGNNNAFVIELNFYGLDYSEHTERKWIYDHGVEVEPISGNGTKNSDNLTVALSGSVQTFRTSKINMSPYKLARVRIGHLLRLGNPNIAVSVTENIGSDSPYSVLDSNLPNNCYLGIGSINSEYYAFISSGGGTNGCAEVTEWWLE